MSQVGHGVSKNGQTFEGVFKRNQAHQERGLLYYNDVTYTNPLCICYEQIVGIQIVKYNYDWIFQIHFLDQDSFVGVELR